MVATIKNKTVAVGCELKQYTLTGIETVKVANIFEYGVFKIVTIAYKDNYGTKFESYSEEVMNKIVLEVK